MRFSILCVSHFLDSSTRFQTRSPLHIRLEKHIFTLKVHAKDENNSDKNKIGMTFLLFSHKNTNPSAPPPLIELHGVGRLCSHFQFYSYSRWWWICGFLQFCISWKYSLILSIKWLTGSPRSLSQAPVMCQLECQNRKNSKLIWKGCFVTKLTFFRYNETKSAVGKNCLGEVDTRKEDEEW